MSDRTRIVLGEEDFAEQADSHIQPRSEVSAAAAAPTLSAPDGPPARLPTVATGRRHEVGGDVPTAPSASSAINWWLAPGRSLLAAATIGVLGGWAITQVLGLGDFIATSKSSANAHIGLWTAVIGVVLGGTMLSFDSAASGAWELARVRFAKAALPMAAASFVAGYIGNAVYQQIIQGVIEGSLRGEAFSPNDIRFYLARALGWALFGVGIGATIGLVSGSRRQAVNGAIGGAIGGTAGGLMFQFVAANLHSGNGLSRLLGLAAVGGLIALATRVVETTRREAWLQVLAGGMAGKEFILYHPVTRVGSAPECELYLLKDPNVAKLHAQIEDSGHLRQLTALPGQAVFVNGAAVETHTLRDGDQLQIGSTLIGYSERVGAG